MKPDDYFRFHNRISNRFGVTFLEDKVEEDILMTSCQKRKSVFRNQIGLVIIKQNTAWTKLLKKTNELQDWNNRNKSI